MSGRNPQSSNTDASGGNTGRPHTTNNPRNNTNNTSKLTGDISELKDNVFHFGSNNQQAQFPKTLEAIAEYCGRVYGGSDMRNLVNGEDNPPKKPERPKTKREDTDGWERMEYEKDYDKWNDRKEEYRKEKSKVFGVIKGQCTRSMKNRLAQESDYKTIETNNDVLGLINKLKSITFATQTGQYDYWLVADNLRDAVLCRMYPNEDLNVYYNRWKLQINVLEEQWGDFLPPKLKKKNAQQSTEKNKFLTCLFLRNLDWDEYGTYLDELNNNYLNGQTDTYPNTPEEALNQLSHRTNLAARAQRHNNRWTYRRNNDNPTPTSFTQQSRTRDENYESDASDIHAHCPDCGQMYVNHTPCNNCGYSTDNNNSFSSHSSRRPTTPPASSTGWSS